MITRTPPSYFSAALRGTLPVDADGSIGVSFDLPNGYIVRLKIDNASARSLLTTLREQIESSKTDVAR